LARRWRRVAAFFSATTSVASVSLLSTAPFATNAIEAAIRHAVSSIAREVFFKLVFFGVAFEYVEKVAAFIAIVVLTEQLGI
jgi:hypothetical protein